MALRASSSGRLNTPKTRAKRSQIGVTGFIFSALRLAALAVADVTNLPFPNASFDAAYANTLLLHLPDPLPALEEIRRVLKPGGLLGVRDPDWGTVLWEPSTPLLEALVALARRVFAERGSPYHARRQRGLLLQAGFGRTAGYAFTESFGAPDATRFWAEVVQGQLREPAFIELVTSRGWTDRATLAAMNEDVRAWGEQPDAFYAILFGAAIGWVTGGEAPGASSAV